MNSHFRLFAAALVLTLGAGGSAVAADKGPHQNCFLSNQWEGWTAPASGGGDVLYLKVDVHDYYRVDLTPGSHAYKAPGYFLVNQVRGSNWICSAIDLDLTISDRMGFHQALIARSLRKLTPAEVAAIPTKDLP